jgi:hypothetical protein
MDPWTWTELTAGFPTGWYVLGVFLAFVLGGLWFSLIFPDRWVRVFKVDMSAGVSPLSMIVTMGINLLSIALYGFLVVIVATVSRSLGSLLILAVFVWEASTLRFQFANLALFLQAVVIHPGHHFLVGSIFLWLVAK